MPSPLSGVRVLDMTRIVSGPVCGRVLADLGADVIKVEAPEGDLTRTAPPVIEGIGALYAHLNAGKRSVCIDIRVPGGAELVASLAARCDVLLENFRPGALSARGLGYHALAAADPGLVYCSITGFGQDGPWTHRRAHAPLMHAAAGTIEVASRLRGAAPVPEVHQHADLYTGFFAVGAVCAALYQRERTGAGQHLDVAMAEVMVYASDQAANDLTGDDGPRELDSWTYPIVRLGNGELACLIGNPLRLYEPWCHALGGDPGDPRPRTVEEASIRLADLAGRYGSYAELEAAFADGPSGPVRVDSLVDLARSEWAAHRGLLAEASPGIDVPARPWRTTGGEIGLAGPAAPLGADTASVLTELVGLEAEELDRLAAAGVIR